MNQRTSLEERVFEVLGKKTSTLFSKLIPMTFKASTPALQYNPLPVQLAEVEVSALPRTTAWHQSLP